MDQVVEVAMQHVFTNSIENRNYKAWTSIFIHICQTWFCQNVKYYLTNVGFALLLSNMSNVTCMTSIILSRMKLRLANQFIHSGA